MANKSLFSSITSVLPRATTVNEAGGPAYKFPAKHALAQLAADPALQQLGRHLVTHHFDATELAGAFETADSTACIKAMVHQDHLR